MESLLISFCNSSKVKPTASFAATLRIENCCFDAKADDLETSDSFQSRPSLHLLINGKLNIDPPVSTPISLRSYH